MIREPMRTVVEPTRIVETGPAFYEPYVYGGYPIWRNLQEDETEEVAVTEEETPAPVEETEPVEETPVETPEDESEGPKVISSFTRPTFVYETPIVYDAPQIVYDTVPVEPPTVVEAANPVVVTTTPIVEPLMYEYPYYPYTIVGEPVWTLVDPEDLIPDEETPVEETPVEEAPVEEAPVEETPVEETPAKKTDEPVITTKFVESATPYYPYAPRVIEEPWGPRFVEPSRVVEAPRVTRPYTSYGGRPIVSEPYRPYYWRNLQEAETTDTPVEAPVEVAPVVEEAPVEEAPVEEVPVEEAPVEEAPVEETPVEETPVEETNEKVLEVVRPWWEPRVFEEPWGTRVIEEPWGPTIIEEP